MNDNYRSREEDLVKRDILDFYYFTGTGNTLLVVREMSDHFKDHGVEVNLFRMEESDPADIDLRHAVGIAFPVACQSTFPLVWDFVRSLPESSGTEIFMVDTMMGFSGGVVGPMRKVLRAKGYTTIGAKEIIMPNNWYPKKIRDEKNRRKADRGLRKAAEYARRIAEGTSRWRRFPVLSDLLCWLATRPVVWRWNAGYGSRFEVDKERCTECQICQKLCPVDNITMDDYPLFGGVCQQCLRCISFCPESAIDIPGKNFQTYRAVKAKDLLGSGAD